MLWHRGPPTNLGEGVVLGIRKRPLIEMVDDLYTQLPAANVVILGVPPEICGVPSVVARFPAYPRSPWRDRVVGVLLSRVTLASHRRPVHNQVIK